MTNFSNQRFNSDFLDDIYQAMLKFATNQLGNEQYAKDVVQDALVNALKYADKFQGKSTFKSWVFAILKNKIADFIRHNNKYVALSDLTDDDSQSDEAFLELLFDKTGHWHNDNALSAFDDSWCNPEFSAEQTDFWHVLELCLNNLPKEQSRVFLMKEYIELDTQEICQELGISTQNFYVLMHRARLRLQTCLSVKWFDD
ncbi:MAG: sigma-70 family RNA polymerase sigma factor [Moraxella sp.]|nr:sigma-70 family RNA polymerase sigma factor [Moraxella sp.]